MIARTSTEPKPDSKSARERHRWSAAFAGEEYYYGADAGPVARRAVRYAPAASIALQGASVDLAPQALDAGCGEGQDLAFLAASGYRACGFDLTSEGAAKTRRLLKVRGLHAEVSVGDLRTWRPDRQYALAICVNALQFLGADAPEAIHQVIKSVAPGGVLGLSLFAREGSDAEVRDNIFYTTLPNLTGRLNAASPVHQWKLLEAANLWQWNERNADPQAFVTLIARRLPDK